MVIAPNYRHPLSFAGVTRRLRREAGGMVSSLGADNVPARSGRDWIVGNSHRPKAMSPMAWSRDHVK